ncbi:MAG: hypothetical protein AB1540_08520 [Bdellovibrionota bacterium]
MNANVISAVAILDQAALTVLELPQFKNEPRALPHSYLLEFSTLERQLRSRNPRPLTANLRILASVGMSLYGLSREWRNLLREQKSISPSRPKPLHYYRAFSLALASAAALWLIAKRH